MYQCNLAQWLERPIKFVKVTGSIPILTGFCFFIRLANGGEHDAHVDGNMVLIVDR